MKLAVLGGGGVRAPMLVAGLARNAGRLDLSEVWLQDVSPERLSAMSVVTRHVWARLGAPARLELTTDADAAIGGADAAFVAIRVGTEEGRLADERIALEEGLIGQETTGPGGFAMALRTVPVAADLARRVARLARPGAVLLNFTNPVGIVTRAMRQAAPGLSVIGLCDTPSGLAEDLSRVLGVGREDLDVGYVGLNHMGWVYKVAAAGRDLMPDLLADGEAMARRVAHLAMFPPGLMATLRLLPNEYCYYYYCPRESLAHQRGAAELRSEQVRRLNRALLEGLARLAAEGAPPNDAEALYRHALGERHRTYMAMETGTGRPDEGDDRLLDGEGGYQQLAIDTLAALRADPLAPVRLILDVPAADALPGYAPDDVVELTCAVSREGARPLPQGPVPDAVAGLMATVANYERLTVRAASTGDRALAVTALLAHPLAGGFTAAERVVDRYLHAHEAYLPRFARHSPPVARPD